MTARPIRPMSATGILLEAYRRIVEREFVGCRKHGLGELLAIFEGGQARAHLTVLMPGSSRPASISLNDEHIDELRVVQRNFTCARNQP